MPYSNQLDRIAKERGEAPEVFIPRLMKELKTPHKVAVELGLYPNSIRVWLVKHGWTFKDGVWQEPAAEEESEHSVAP